MIFLVLGALFIYLILIPFGTLQLAKYLDRRGSEKSKIFYESFISRAIVWNRSEALYEYGAGLANPDGKFQITMMGWGGGSPTSLEDIDKGINAFKKILEKERKSKKDMKYTILAYESIMDAYINLQSPEDLLMWIDWGREYDNKEINYISDLYLSFYHFANRDYDMAEEILSKYDESEDIDYKYFYLKSELALFQGDIDLAKELYKKSWEIKDHFQNDKGLLFGSYTYAYRDYWYEDHYDKIKGDIKVRGRVSYNGQPMPFVEVYLQETGQGYRSGGGYLVGITDINGEYESLGFQPDRYEIGIGLNQALLYDKVHQNPNDYYLDLEEDMIYNFSFVNPFKLIEPGPNRLLEGDKFTVKWEEVEGAAYYQVHMTAFTNPLSKHSGSVSFPIEDENRNIKLKENKAVFDMEILKERSGGLSWDGDNMMVAPLGILSVFVPDNSYPLVVNAYDDKGGLINSSSPLRTFYEDFPSIVIQGELSQGEKLIYAMKYEEAIDYYTNLLEKDPNNIEALYYLSRIYMVSYEKDKYDYDKAMEYAIRYDELKGRNYLKLEVIDFMDHKSRRQHRDLIEETFENVSKEARDDRYYSNLSRYYLSIREYKLAGQAFEILDYDHIFTLYIDLYFGEIDRALDLISSGNFNMYNMNKKQVEKALKGIKNTDSEDYRIIKDIIEKVLSEDLEEGQGEKISSEAKKQIKDPYVSILLDQIIQDNHWNRYID